MASDSSGIPDLHVNQIGSIHNFDRDFDSSVAQKEQKWSESGLQNDFADILDRWLWKEVLEARTKVIHDYISLRTRQDVEDESTLQRLMSEVPSDLDRHCKSSYPKESFFDREMLKEKQTIKGKAVKLFQKMREFHHKHIEISRDEDRALFRVVATRMTADEFEKDANERNDEPMKDSIKERRSTTLMSIEERLEQLHWIVAGRGIYSTGQIAQNTNRYILGFLGGFALLVPMTIMVLHPGRLTALVTTIVSVFFVALGLSAPSPLLRVGPSDAFTGVAIYSAVLVVFVGASTTSDMSKIDKGDKVVASGLLGATSFVLVLLGGANIVVWRATHFRSKSRRGRTDRQTEEV